MKKVITLMVAFMLALGVSASASNALADKTPKRTANAPVKKTTVSKASAKAKSANSKTTNTKMANETPITGDVLVDVTTTVGDFTLKLYELTPKHRDNFVKNVKAGVYDGVLFHRVIDEFMVQTGDPSSKDAKAGQMLGDGDLGYTVEAEFLTPKLFHKRGALAAARTGDQVNPQRRSSASQFYVVTGRKFTNEQLDAMEQQMQYQQMQQIFDTKARAHIDAIRAMQQANDTEGLKALEEKLVKETEAEAAANPAKFTPEMREAYTTVGGTPHLDGTYTVFGEVVKGMETIEKIEKAETDGNDRPKEDIRVISMKIVK